MYAIGMQCLRCDYEASGLEGPATCPKCSANLEIHYDYTSIRKAWWRPTSLAEGRQDLWRYAPLLPVQDLKRVPPIRVGMTPLYPALRLGESFGLRSVWLKDEGLNPSASLKDRASSVVAVRGLETRASVLAGASTGNAGSSMACLAAATGQRAVIFVPRRAPQAKIAQLLTFGATVLAVDGTYDDAFALCERVCRERGWLNRNTGSNPFTREGKKTCALEIAEQLGWTAPDRVVVSVGDGNILSGLWKGLKDLHALGFIDRLPQMVAVQSTASNAISRTVQAFGVPTYGPEGSATPSSPVGAFDPQTLTIAAVRATTRADSISVDTPADGLAAVRAILESGGTVVEVTDDEIDAQITNVARLAGVFGEPAGVASVAGLRRLAVEGAVGADERVVCVITGNGLKDVAAAMRVAGEPTLIEPTLAAFDKVWKS